MTRNFRGHAFAVCAGTIFPRRLMRESTLSTGDLIYPVFVLDGKDRAEPVASVPGVERQNLDHLLATAARASELGISALAIFPVIDPSRKTPGAEGAWNPDGLIPRVVTALKRALPALGVITDVALDPYTSHGHDGLITAGDPRAYVLNDETIEALEKQALTHARAGADVVAPSDMMDGRIDRIRLALDRDGQIHTRIMAYSAKYASNFESVNQGMIQSFVAAPKARTQSSTAFGETLTIDAMGRRESPVT